MCAMISTRIQHKCSHCGKWFSRKPLFLYSPFISHGAKPFAVACSLECKRAFFEEIYPQANQLQKVGT